MTVTRASSRRAPGATPLGPAVVFIAAELLAGMLGACDRTVPLASGSDPGDTDSGVDDGPPPPPCVPPPSHPSTTSSISLFADADGHTGTDNSCPKVGVRYAITNPLRAWCRRLGGLVSGSQGYNHWWLWTELDQPVGALGWISAYYIQGQGNDQANGIPDCP